MVRIAFSNKFQKISSKIKNKELKEKIFKQIIKIRENPEIGKPMMYSRKGTKELHIKPFRISYVYIQQENKIVILNLYHKDEQ